jgi:phosphoribosylamine--glycine ligase
MRVLVIGSGGREHALVWKISRSPVVDRIYAAPGNGGIARMARCVDIKDTNVHALADFAKKEGIDLTVVGPEAPLVSGIADEFAERGLRVFGPSGRAALLEGSKVFSKGFMKKYNIPTADFMVFDDYSHALQQIDTFGFPVVIKADGLAAGKGVIIARDRQQAEQGLREIMLDRKFGDAGAKVLVEEFLEGTEMTMLCFTDGNTMVPMESARDYKRAFDGDKGPNTGGMGTFSPNDIYTPDIDREFRQRIMLPVLDAIKAENMDYRGVLYFGLMVTDKGMKVLEFNCRFGDPETQVILPRLETDLVDIMNAVVDGRLADVDIKWSRQAAVCVVMASGGYPSEYKKGMEIRGLDQDYGEDLFVFHAGTLLDNGKYYTSGGRVLGVTALGDNIRLARQKAYAAVSNIDFEGAQFRKDIAKIW